MDENDHCISSSPQKKKKNPMNYVTNKIKCDLVLLSLSPLEKNLKKIKNYPDL